jgi:hypothetical protein
MDLAFILSFFLVYIGVQLACFGPSLNNHLAQKDAPGKTRHLVFWVSKMVTRWS